MTDTASTAPENEITPVLGGDNSLETDMSDAELEAFVDKTLGIKPKVAAKDDKKDDSDESKASGANDKPTEPKADTKKPEEKATDKPKEDKKPEGDELVVAAPQEDEVKPAEIPAVDLSDLFVEIDAYMVDDKGENPQEQSIRINVGDSIPDNARFKSDKQLYEVLEAQQEMRVIRDQRNKEFEAKTKEAEKVTNDAANKQATLDGWDAEIADLIEDGQIIAPKVKPGDDGFLEDPSTKLVDQVFKFMTTENDKRLKDGKRPIQSFETAFNKFNRLNEDKAKEEKEKEDAELAKKRGSLVGGGSSSTAPSTPPKVYRAGSARTIYQVDTSDL